MKNVTEFIYSIVILRLLGILAMSVLPGYTYRSYIKLLMGFFFMRAVLQLLVAIGG
ncbi:MAG: hypothetical protein ACI4CT_00385 [Lachnospiraceae bacterium]